MKKIRLFQRFIFTSVLAAAAFFPASIVRADTVEVTPSANAFVLRSAADTDQLGDSTTLSTKQMNDSNTRIAYVRFDLTSFLATHSIAGITAVNLRLFKQSANAATVNIYGLNSIIGGTNEFDNMWTNIMTWNGQPAKTAAPNDIPKTGTTLPNANTTPALASTSYGTTNNVEISFPLSLADFKSFLATNGDANISLLFFSTTSVQTDWASRDNTSGFLVPTLELSAPALATGTATWSGAVNGDWDTNTVNWNVSGSPTNFIQGYSAIFNDSLAGNSTVNLTMPLTTSSV